VALQGHVGEVERHHLAGRQADQVHALAVGQVVVGPVGRDDDALAFGVGAAAARVRCGAGREGAREGGCGWVDGESSSYRPDHMSVARNTNHGSAKTGDNCIDARNERKEPN